MYPPPEDVFPDPRIRSIGCPKRSCWCNANMRRRTCASEPSRPTMFDGECMVMSWEELHIVQHWGFLFAFSFRLIGSVHQVLGSGCSRRARGQQQSSHPNSGVRMCEQDRQKQPSFLPSSGSRYRMHNWEKRHHPTKKRGLYGVRNDFEK